MKLPDKFLFVADDDIYIYEATIAPNFTYLVTWQESDSAQPLPPMLYGFSEVEQFIRKGSWKILPESFNKVDSLVDAFAILISENDGQEDLSDSAAQALQITRVLINRLLNDRS